MPQIDRRPRVLALLLVLAVALVALWLWHPWAAAPELDPRGGSATAGTEQALETPTGQRHQRTADAVEAATRRREAGWSEADPAPAWDVSGHVAVQARTPLGEGAEIRAFRGRPDDRPGLLRGMMSQLARLDPGAAPQGFSLETQGEPLARAPVAADGSFALRITEPHVRLVLDHDLYALPEPLPVHLDPRDRRVELGRLDTYLGALVRAWTMPRVEAGMEALLVADPDPMGVMRDPEAFLGQIAGGGRRAVFAADDGSFTFRQVWPGPFNQVLMRDGNRFAQSERFPLAAGELRELRLIPRAGATLEVTVRGPGGVGHADASVRATPDDVAGDMSRAYASQGGRTDAAGVATLEGLRPGPYRITANATGLLSATLETTVAEGSQKLDIQLGQGLSIRGRVVDGAGAPIADVGVRPVPVIEVPILGDVTSAMGTDIAARTAEDSDVRTDGEGRFEIGGLEPGEFHVAASHPAFLPGLHKNAAAGDTSVEIVLEPGGTIEGRVVADEEGSPVRDYTLEIVETMFFIDRPSRIERVTDTADGAFRIDRTPTGRVRLKVMAPGFGDLEQTVEVRSGETTDAGDLRLRRPAAIRGFVRDEFGSPIAGARIGRRQRGPMENPIMASFFGDLACQSDDDGSFELTGIAPGRIELHATAEGFASGLSDRLELEAGEVVEGVVITLGHGGSIVGRLLVPDGMDPTGWDVLPNRMPAGAVASVRPAADGTFRIDNLDPGRYDVQALRASALQQLDLAAKRDWAPGRPLDLGSMFEAMNDMILHASCTVRAGETAEVELDASYLEADVAVLDLRVELGDRPLDSGYVEVRHGASGRTWFGFLQQGRLRLRGVTPGALRVQVRGGLTMAPVGLAQHVEFSPDDGPLTIDLPGGAIAGQVLDAASGQPLRAALVRVFEQDRIDPDETVEFGFALSDEDGRFRFDGLPDGSYTVIGDNRLALAGSEDVAGRVRDIQVSGGTTREITVRGTPGAGLAVHVTTPLGSDASGVTVLALGADGKPLGTLPIAHTNSDGHAFLSGLTAGTVRVLARGPGSSPVASDPIEIAAAQRLETRLRLGAGAHVWVTVVDGAGEVLRGATLAARRGDAPWVPDSVLVVGRDGDKLDLGTLEPGSWEFLVVPPSGAAFRTRRTIPSSAHATLLLGPN